MYKTLEQAIASARKEAAFSGGVLIVYMATHQKDIEQYGTAYTLPLFGVRLANVLPDGRILMVDNEFDQSPRDI